ncbi:MAG: Nif3-like dinuclear metal center hexameric protein, partial [Anaerolineae bacterium]|nr:Nif3-like dinuclear metal center hexameric protein [Anaerolineae bacterium]
PVYKATRRLLKENNIVVWQFHDHWHLHRPDGILTGMLKELGWKNQVEAEQLARMNAPVESLADYYAMVKAISHVNIPPMSLLDLAKMFKEKLDIQQVRIVGNLDLICSRLVLLPGKADGKVQMEWLGQDDVNVLVCGEINEGEPDEYVRDAIQLQQKKGLIILGHANSEEAGMKWCAEWLRSLLPELKITYLPTGDPFRFV